MINDLKVPSGVLTTSSAKEQSFYEWVPVLFGICMWHYSHPAVGFMLFHCSTVGGISAPGNVATEAMKKTAS